MRSGRIHIPEVKTESKIGSRWWRTKYMVEWIFCLLAIVALSPIYLGIGIAIVLQDGGNALYLSKRVGRNRRRFTLYKFRSMKPNSRRIVTPDLKIITVKNDPRVTLFGRYLRVGADELPQLFNVLRGEMCLIGPRPGVAAEVPLMNARERLRFAVLPGITGVAQVLGGRRWTNQENWEIDARYIENSSFCTDLLVVVCTILYVFGYRTPITRILRSFVIETRSNDARR